MASLVLTDSSQLTSDRQHLVKFICRDIMALRNLLQHHMTLMVTTIASSSFSSAYRLMTIKGSKKLHLALVYVALSRLFDDCVTSSCPHCFDIPRTTLVQRILYILAVTSALIVCSSAQFGYGNGCGPLFLDGTSYPRLIPIKYSSPLSSGILSAVYTTAVYPGFNSGQMYVPHCRRPPWSGHYAAGSAYSDLSPGDVIASSTANRDDSENVSSTADVSTSVNQDYFCCASVGTTHGYSDRGKVSAYYGNRYPSLSDKQALVYSAANSGDSDVASAADVNLSLGYSTHSDVPHYTYYSERYDPEQSAVAVSTSSTVNSYDSAVSFTSSADTGVGLNQISLPHVDGPSCDGYDDPGYVYPPSPKYEATVVTSAISSRDSAAASSEGGNFRYPPHGVYQGWGGYFDPGLSTSFAPYSASSNGISDLYSVYGDPNPYYGR
uniref:Uncharacterized protein n=1 Tax=Timema monikensis TaxID=170555 RepID=A0A7R9HPY7_9NEOP|nr:unnamed protein product [Timema monikensis]